MAITSHGATTKVEKGRFAFLPVILGAENVDNSGATAPSTITVKYRKQNSLSFLSKTLNNTTSTTSAAASASDTTVKLVDSSSFPPFGKAYVENELVEYTANNVSTGTLTLSSGLSGNHNSGVTVTRIDWLNLSSDIASAGSTEGYYLILFTNTELSALGTFTY